MTVITADQIKALREKTGVAVGKCKRALEDANGDVELAIELLRKAGIASAVKKESRETNEGAIEVLVTADKVVMLEMNAETDFVVNNERFKAFHKELVQDAADLNISDVDAFLASSSKAHAGKTVDERRKELVAVLGEHITLRRILNWPKLANHSYGVYSHMGGKLLVLLELAGSTGQDDFAREISMHIAAESPDFVRESEVPADLLAKEEEIAQSQVAGGNKPQQILDKIVAGKVKAFYDQVCLLNQKYIKDNSITVAELVAARSKEIGKELSVTRFVRWRVGG